MITKYMNEKFDYKDLLKNAKNVSNRINRNKFITSLDMFFCRLKYGCSFNDYENFEFHLLNSKQRQTYLTEGINNKIIDKYNKNLENFKFENKLEFNNFFKDYIGREYIDIRQTSFNDFKLFLIGKEKIVSKKLECDESDNITIYNVVNLKSFDILKIYNNIIKSNQYLVEEYIYQHTILNELYPLCVNSIQITTFLYDNHVNILNSGIRIGNNSDINSFSDNSIYAPIDKNGVVYKNGIDKDNLLYQFHPHTNKNILNLNIPNYDKIIEFVTKIACQVPTIRYVSWNVAIRSNDIILIGATNFPEIIQFKTLLNDDQSGKLKDYSKYIEL